MSNHSVVHLISHLDGIKSHFSNYVIPSVTHLYIFYLHIKDIFQIYFKYIVTFSNFSSLDTNQYHS